MKTIQFAFAGVVHENEQIFLVSKMRTTSHNKTIFHRNKYNSEVSLPLEFFKLHFKFDRFSGIYRTKLKYGDIKQFLKVYDVDNREYIIKTLHSNYSNNAVFNSGL